MNSKTAGRLIGVSLGPGDPDLITRGAWGILQDDDALWSWPVKQAGGDSYALDITRRAGLRAPEDGVALIFPMTRDAALLDQAWAAAAETVLPFLKGGRDVLFLCEGDVSTYSTFGHLARGVTQRAPQVQISAIAGVSAPQACAARLGVSLTEQDDALAVLPAGYGVEVVERLLDQFDRLALMKVNPVLDEVIDLLERRGLLEHAHLVERAGAVDERVVRDIAVLKGQKVNYLSTLLVHNPRRDKAPLAAPGCRKR